MDRALLIAGLAVGFTAVGCSRTVLPQDEGAPRGDTTEAGGENDPSGDEAIAAGDDDGAGDGGGDASGVMGDVSAGDDPTGDLANGDTFLPPVSCPADFGAGTHAGTWVNGSGYLSTLLPSYWQLDSSWAPTADLFAYWKLNRPPGLVRDSAIYVDDEPAGRDLRAFITPSTEVMYSVIGHIDTSPSFESDQRTVLATNVAGSVDLMAPLTVMAWVNLALLPLGDDNTVAQGGMISEPKWWFGIDVAGLLTFKKAEMSQSFWSDTVTAITPFGSGDVETWSHVAVTVDGTGNYAFYRDGLPDGSGTLSSAMISAIGPRHMYAGGADFEFGLSEPRTLHGQLDELSLWTRDLTAMEVAAIHARQAAGMTGVFTSANCDSQSAQVWRTLSFTPESPAGKGVSAMAESGYASGNHDPTSLVGLFHFDGPEMTLGVNAPIVDSSLFASDGRTQGNAEDLARVPGMVGQALSFDGATGYVDMGPASPLQVSTPLTVTVWVFHERTDGDRPIFESTFNTSSRDQHGIKIRSNDGVAVVQIYDGGDCTFTSARRTTLTDEPVFASHNWHHLAVTAVDEANVRVFVDGVEAPATSSGAGNPLMDGPANPRLGHGNPCAIGVQTYFEGRLDELAVYARVLGDNEIAALHNRGRWRVRLQVRTCDTPCTGETFVGPGDSPTTFFEESLFGGTTPPSFSIPTPRRHAQWRVWLYAPDARHSLVLRDVTLSTP